MRMPERCVCVLFLGSIVSTPSTCEVMRNIENIQNSVMRNILCRIRITQLIFYSFFTTGAIKKLFDLAS